MVDLRFNFVGVEAADFQRAYAFYADVLGVWPAEAPPADEPGSWAMLVAGWDETSAPEGHGLRCELFEQDVDPPDERWWGRNQNVRPSVQVADVDATVTELRERGVSFTGDRTDTRWGASIEFATPEGVRWSLADARRYPAGPGLQVPHLGWVELKVADLAGQRGFYTEVMGLSVGEQSEAGVRLEQDAGDPLLFLEPGGERVTEEGAPGSAIDLQPVWMSFETTDITEAYDWLTDHGVDLYQEVTTHDWAGTDLLIRDVDGNPVQVVEYHET